VAKKVDHPVRIDLIDFKLDIHLKDQMALSLHFNSPSRKFYLSLIALVVMEMRKRGKIVPISLEEHLGLLALLNETVGGSAGSSEKKNLLHRIYRKWKHALPNLEEAPLFMVAGKKKEFDGVDGKNYLFTEPEKDRWANLFAYTGSEENVRLKFAIDKIGGNLDNILITWGDLRNEEAWESFLAGLQGEEEKPKTEPDTPELEEPAVQPPQVEESPMPRPVRYRRVVWMAAVPLVLAVVTWGIWKMVSKPGPLPVAAIGKMAYPLPDKPSIAVLPFDNLSGDPQQEFFSDGLTEEIITTLSKSPYLFVIARHSSSIYKGKSVTVKQVAEELGIRFVLEGSIRRSGDKLRITAQLVDAAQGNHIWAERYDRDIQDMFNWQDEISLTIMKKLHVKLEPRDRAQETGRGTGNVEAYLKTMEARGHILRYTKEDNAQARKMFEEVVALDPNYAKPYLGLAISHAAEVWLGTSKSPQESLKQAIEMANKALALDGSDGIVYSCLAYLMAMTRQYEKSVAYAEKALALNPNSYMVLMNAGSALLYADRPDEAISLLLREERLNPFAPAISPMILCWAYRMAGQYDKALEQAKKAVERDRKQAERAYIPQVALAGAYMMASHEAEGRAAAVEVLRINPGFSLDQYARTLPFKNRSKVDLEIAALRRAGLR
jgi:TolB-like protein